MFKLNNYTIKMKEILPGVIKEPNMNDNEKDFYDDLLKDIHEYLIEANDNFNNGRIFLAEDRVRKAIMLVNNIRKFTRKRAK